ncbi:MAG: hypothetical protein UU91_C0016G0002 [candidate division WWE3 bacterium GW2011_GWB1_42_117]|nr:MAG: hypothetical protein UU91_C0016G0002 [candidate division WWE3 bacterium GW2011_GWB1_42_117]
MIEKHWPKVIAFIVLVTGLAVMLLPNFVIFDQLVLHNASMVLIGFLAAIGTERFINAKTIFDQIVSIVSYALALYIALTTIMS